MPQVTGTNPDGTFNVLRDDGVSVTTAWLPPDLMARVPAPSAAPVATPEDIAEAEALEQGAVPAPARAPTAEEQVAGFIQSAQSANPYATQQVVQSVGTGRMGFEPTPKPKGLEFNGFTGDPAVVQRRPDGSGYEYGGRAGPSGYGPTGAAARSDIGGAPPAARGQQAPGDELTPDRFAPINPAAAAQPGAAPASPGDLSASLGFKALPKGPSRSGMDKAYALQVAAVGERAALEQQRAAGEVARLEELDRGERKRQADANERQAVAAQSVEEARGNLTSMVNSLNEPSGELDPARWWNSRNTGQKIAAFASAFLSGVARQPDMIQQYIQDDIAAQRYNLDRADRNKQAKVEGAKTLLGVARERFQDTLLADAAARSAALENASRIADIATARYKEGDAGVRRQELLADLAKQKAEADTAFAARAQQLGLQQAELALKLRAQQAEQVQQYAALAAEGGRVVDQSTLTPEQRKRAVFVAPGRAVLAVDEDSAKKLRAAEEGHADLTEALREMLTLRQEFGPETLNRTAVERAETLRTKALFGLKKMEAAGALDQGMIDIGTNMLGDAVAWKPGVEAKIQTNLDLYNNQLTRSFQRYTGQPLQRATPKPRAR